MGKEWKQLLNLSFWASKLLQMVIAAVKLKYAYSLEGSYDQSRKHIKKQRHYFVNKGPFSQGYRFSNGHIWMWELDYNESWPLKSWCFCAVVLEKTLESPLDCKEIEPVHPKGDKSWCSFEGLMLKLNLLYFATWCEELTPLKWPWWWERLRPEDEEEDRVWDGWMASPTQLTWVWVNCRSCW